MALMSCFSAPCGVFHLQRLDDDAFKLLGGFLHLGYGLRFVALDADIGIRHTKGFAQDADTDANLLGVLHHHTVVARQVRLALGGIDNQILGLLAFRHVVFDVCGEGGSAEADDAHLFELGDNLLRRQRALALDVGRAVDGLHPFVAFDVDVYCWLGDAEGILAAVNLQNRAAHGRVDVGTHESLGLTNQLSNFYFVAFLHHWGGRGSEVLVHQNHHLLAHRHHLDGGIVRYLVLFGVYTTHSECFHLFELEIES